MQFHNQKKKKSNVHQERKIKAHAMWCILVNALLKRQFLYMIANVGIDNGYPLLSTNHEFSYREQNTSNCLG